LFNAFTSSMQVEQAMPFSTSFAQSGQSPLLQFLQMATAGLE
jgi:hypothetical protein